MFKTNLPILILYTVYKLNRRNKVGSVNVANVLPVIAEHGRVRGEQPGLHPPGDDAQGGALRQLRVAAHSGSGKREPFLYTKVTF